MLAYRYQQSNSETCRVIIIMLNTCINMMPEFASRLPLLDSGNKRTLVKLRERLWFRLHVNNMLCLKSLQTFSVLY